MDRQMSPPNPFRCTWQNFSVMKNLTLNLVDLQRIIRCNIDSAVVDPLSTHLVKSFTDIIISMVP